MGLQTQIYFADEESLKTHEAWGKALKDLGKDGSQYALAQFIKDVFFFVIKDEKKIVEFTETQKIRQ
ncbi:hypothetical protein MSIBF_A4250003 [groundwater metagenome]|uniref:Uncharacterized protein n=1 Tax=groundwater metagenome TaxID=717931 RepID=A0A098E7N5_9ZZZZ